MKLTFTKTTVLFTCISFMLVGIAGWFIKQRLFAVQSYSFAIDQRLSDCLTQEIREYISALDKTACNGVAIESIQKAFPVTKSIAMHYNCAGNAHFSIIAYTPIMQVNSDYLLLESGVVVAKASFAQNMVHDLYCMNIPHVTNNYCLSSQVLESIASIPDKLFEGYAITLVDQKTVQLQDNNDNHFIIHAHIASLPDQACLNKCNSIKTTLDKEGKLHKKRWIADVRFKNQIIVAMEKSRGRYEKKSFFRSYN